MDGKNAEEREEEAIQRPAHDLWDVAPGEKKEEKTTTKTETIRSDNTVKEEDTKQQSTQHESMYTEEKSEEKPTPPVQTPPQQFDQLDEDEPSSIGTFLRGFLIVMLILFAGLAFFFFRNKTATDTNSETPNAVTPIPSTSPTTATTSRPVETPGSTPVLATKRLYNPKGNFFESTKYPTALLSYKDAELVGISCSGNYSCTNAGCTALTKNAYAPTNDTVTSWYKQAVLTTSTSNISQMQACQTSDNQTVLLYHQPGNTEGIGSIDYVGRVESDETVTRLVAITNLSYPHFICDKPLQITNLNLLFLQCSSGNDQFKSETIYGVNMMTSAYTQLENCTEQQDPNTKKMVSTCQ